MRHLTLSEVLELHRRVISRSGGTTGLHNGAVLALQGELASIGARPLRLIPGSSYSY